MDSEAREDLQRYIEDVEYPAYTDDLVATAEAQGAPASIIEQLRNLGPQQFAGPEGVMAALQPPPQEPGRTGR